MSLGDRIRQARLELGLSQRQLGGEVITRNMLSLIESGSAVPSLQTLLYLSRQLQKPVGYFLEEETEELPNRQVMEQARTAYAKGDLEQALTALNGYRSPDVFFDAEEALLEALICTSMAEEAISREKGSYALELLHRAEEAGERTPYDTPELRRRRLLALAQLQEVELPPDDRELLLRAESALGKKNFSRAAQYLEAAQNWETPKWNFLRGEVCRGIKEYQSAVAYYEKAQAFDPKLCTAALEECYREMEDYRSAYQYACLLRELEQNER